MSLRKIQTSTRTHYRTSASQKRKWIEKSLSNLTCPLLSLSMNRIRVQLSCLVPEFIPWKIPKPQLLTFLAICVHQVLSMIFHPVKMWSREGWLKRMSLGHLRAWMPWSMRWMALRAIWKAVKSDQEASAAKNQTWNMKPNRIRPLEITS